SSRSHSCLIVHVQGRDLMLGTILCGCMHLVDLADSERVDKSEVTGDRLKEAQHINKSLSVLGDVISSFAQKNPHVPYRNSKLTELLQDSLGRQTKTLMFVHISLEPDAVGETISTVKFAERFATVELGAAHVNKDSADVKELKEQIATLKTALARKEGEPEDMQHSFSNSSERYRTKTSDLPPFHCKKQAGDMLDDQNSCRQPMWDVGNIEARNNSMMRQKNQSFDLEELLGKSPPWPPVSSDVQNYVEDDKDIGSGQWVYKVMVNKQDIVPRVRNPLGCWETENRNLPDAFYQKLISDSSKLFPDQSYNIFMANNCYDIANNDDLHEDAATGASFDADLLWQFNKAKITSMINGIESKIMKPNTKPTNSPELRNLNSTVGPSPSWKLSNGVGTRQHRNGRHPVPAYGKRKIRNRN
ncbi:kinesin-like protein KIN-14I, partial [Vitis riparia]|uniref:kinesin-like protein KIN-14I n=1 Tax=Vitis riparia TaxID=96939 RepID=UPI00155AD522